MSLKVVRSLCFCSFLDLILFASLAITVQAQSVNSQGTNSEPPPPRNADAVKVLEMAYQAMGGAQGWRDIRESDVEGMATVSRGQPQPFHWKDTWAGKGHMERTGPDSHGKQRYTVFDEGEKAKLQSAHGNFSKPNFDRALQLMTHMPGAVIDLVLSDPRYGVEPAVGLSQLPAASCVTVYRNRFNIAGGGLQAIICFNKQTSMPERATVMLANLARQGATVPEKIQYKEFQQMGAILVPKLVEVTNPVGVHTLYSITSIHTAPAAGGHQ